MRLNADRASPWGDVTKRALTRLNPATRILCLCLLSPKQKLSVFKSGFPTSPILTATDLPEWCQVTTTSKTDSVCHSALRAYRLLLDSAGNQPLSTKESIRQLLRFRIISVFSSVNDNQESSSFSRKSSFITNQHNKFSSSSSVARNTSAHTLRQ